MNGTSFEMDMDAVIAEISTSRSALSRTDGTDARPRREVGFRMLQHGTNAHWMLERRMRQLLQERLPRRGSCQWMRDGMGPSGGRIDEAELT